MNIVGSLRKENAFVRGCGHIASIFVFALICLLFAEPGNSQRFRKHTIQSDSSARGEGGVKEQDQPKLITDIDSMIRYPETALRRRVEGDVYMSALVETDGRVAATRVVSSGHPEFVKEAERVLRLARFTPAVSGGKPVKMWHLVPIEFRLPGHTKPKPGEVYSALTIVEKPVAHTAPVPAAPRDTIDRPTPLIAIESNLAYPKSAKDAGVEGKVVVDAFVDTNGEVLETKVDSFDDLRFIDPAKSAVMNTLFAPGLKDGVKVKAWVRLPVEFKLPKD